MYLGCTQNGGYDPVSWRLTLLIKNDFIDFIGYFLTGMKCHDANTNGPFESGSGKNISAGLLDKCCTVVDNLIGEVLNALEKIAIQRQITIL